MDPTEEALAATVENYLSREEDWLISCLDKLRDDDIATLMPVWERMRDEALEIFGLAEAQLSYDVARRLAR